MTNNAKSNTVKTDDDFESKKMMLRRWKISKIVVKFTETSYVVEYTLLETFEDKNKKTVPTTATETVMELTGLMPDTTYYVRVIAIETGVFCDSVPSDAKLAKTKESYPPGDPEGNSSDFFWSDVIKKEIPPRPNILKEKENSPSELSQQMLGNDFLESPPDR